MPESKADTSRDVQINTETVCSFRASKTLSYHTQPSVITSIDFDDNGAYALTAGTDESIQMYNMKQGKHIKTIYSKKYGATLAKFTHNEMNCIYASTKEDGM